MEFETLLFEKQDGYAIVTMNRPERLNAFSRQLNEEMDQAIHEILRDDDIKCFIITGAPRPDGRPCFSAGGDLKDDAAGIPRWDYPDHVGPLQRAEEKLFPANTPAGRLWHKRPRLTAPKYTNLLWSPKISIAAVDGIATAGGIEMALACDIMLAADTAQFTDSHVKNLKIAIGKGSVTTGLARRVGYSKALELCLLGEFIDGQTAYEIGLANRVYPSADLLDRAKDMAATIASMRPEAVQMTKLACRAAEDSSLNDSWAYADELLESMSADASFAGLQDVTQEWAKRDR